MLCSQSAFSSSSVGDRPLAPYYKHKMGEPFSPLYGCQGMFRKLGRDRLSLLCAFSICFMFSLKRWRDGSKSSAFGRLASATIINAEIYASHTVAIKHNALFLNIVRF